MKKNSYLFLLASFLLLFASCDKIDESQYMVYSGAVGEWIDGDGVADHTQRAIIEKYTGVRCMNCPTAEEAINTAVAQYNGKLIAVAIHDSSAFSRPYNNEPNLSSSAGYAWSKFFGVFDASQYPMALVNRTPAGSGWDLFNPVSAINSHVDPIVNNNASVALQVSAQNSQDALSVIVNLEFLETVSDKLNVTLFVMEDGIHATQLLPDGHTKDENYVHNHLLRDVITDLWGAEVDCTGKAGEKRMALFTYTEANPEWNLSNCHIVAMITNRDTRQVLNVAECHIQ